MTIKLNQHEIKVALGTYVWDYLLPKDKDIKFEENFAISIETCRNSLVSVEITFKEKE